MSVLKKLLKATARYDRYKTYMDELKAKQVANQDQSLVPFNISSSVEQELLATKEAARKARNKRKATKNRA